MSINQMSSDWLLDRSSLKVFGDLQCSAFVFARAHINLSVCSSLELGGGGQSRLNSKKHAVLLHISDCEVGHAY